MASKKNSKTYFIDLTNSEEDNSDKKEIKVEEYEFCTCMESISISVQKVSKTSSDNGDGDGINAEEQYPLEHGKNGSDATETVCKDDTEAKMDVKPK